MNDDYQMDGCAPLLECSHLESWATFARYLCTLGIEVTANALENRRRRYDLPVQGGGARGRPVYFQEKEIDAWVRHLTGYSRRTWMSKQKRAIRDGRGLQSAPPGRRASAGAKHLPRFDLYAITSRPPAQGERLLRYPRGNVCAARDPAVFQEVFAAGGLESEDWRAWRYFGMRNATASDLHTPAKSRPRHGWGQAGRLIAGVVRHGTVFRWCRVPGPLFGLEKKVMTPFLTAVGRPGFAEVVTWAREHEPEVVFLTWPRRVEVEPVSLEELPHGDLHELIDESAR